MGCNGARGTSNSSAIFEVQDSRRHYPSPRAFACRINSRLRFASLGVPINLMRRRPTMKQSMGRLGLKDTGGHARIRLLSPVTVSCAFSLIVCASLFVLFNPKNPKPEVVAIMVTQATQPVVALPSHEPPEMKTETPETETEKTETETTAAAGAKTTVAAGTKTAAGAGKKTTAAAGTKTTAAARTKTKAAARTKSKTKTKAVAGTKTAAAAGMKTTTTTERVRESEVATMFKPEKRCAGRYIFVYKLPRRFNSDMLRSCSTISRWTDMCLFTSNAGLGPKLDSSGGAFFGRGWYATNQFALEVIFHNRMKQYDCLTQNASQAAAVFVPYYAGLDISRYLWDSTAAERDEAPRALIRWLRSRPEWSAMRGMDHFMVGGRITWDFQRPTNDDDDWGNKLLLTPEVKRMTVLLIESSPWLSHDFGIPYPTYFHPSSDGEVQAWQDRMRKMKRPWLFSFAGGARSGELAWIRNEAMGQCRRSRQCKLLECGIGKSDCHLPGTVMKLFQRSTFCLQPQGDSYTRRSSFDAMVAGCVPVFFHPGSAYVQYTWHLPKNYSTYSVFIGEDEVRRGGTAGSIEEVLRRFKKNEVTAMREEVIKMIPRLVYADPRANEAPVRDAFDLAVEGVIKRVKEMKEGKAPAFKERESWKRALIGTKEIWEWDHFFGNPKNQRT